ncbi:BTB/POZ domain-containing protein At1g63850, partial [Linum perenne]
SFWILEEKWLAFLPISNAGYSAKGQSDSLQNHPFFFYIINFSIHHHFSIHIPPPWPEPPPPPPLPVHSPPRNPSQPRRLADPPPDSSSKIRFSSGGFSPVMDFARSSPTPLPVSNGHDSSSHSTFPSSFTKFNSALTAGLLNPLSPPPDRLTRSSPTLFEMMASEHDIQPKSQTPITITAPHVPISKIPQAQQQQQQQDRQTAALQRIADILGNRSPGSQFNDSSSSDVKLTLSSKDGISVSISVHRQILVAHSRFFAVKLSDRWAKQQKASGPYVVEIADCDDIEVYIETLRLMYSKDLRRRLMKDAVAKVLGILKVSAAIGFDAGVLSCLEYLEAAPWAEDEEDKVASLLSELRLEGVGAGEVLKRMSAEVNNGVEENSDSEEVLLKLLHVVLEGKDEKARREMKGLVAKMLRESSSSHTDLRKESLYSACEGCLQLLRTHFLQASSGNLKDVGQIARQADNLHWLLDIMIDRQIAEEFLKTWASQTELSEAHSKIPAAHRYEVSRVTARLFVGIGKGQMLASKEARCTLLQTWLVPFYDDFGWMRRAHKGLDRHMIEDGLGNTILTLPLSWQQDILLAWFNRFLNSGDDCPNIQRGFEIWWRRAFWRRNGEQGRTRSFRVVSTTADNL